MQNRKERKIKLGRKTKSGAIYLHHTQVIKATFCTRIFNKRPTVWGYMLGVGPLKAGHNAKRPPAEDWKAFGKHGTRSATQFV
jgi:hypothetical protein